jgi:hypothetical protein
MEDENMRARDILMGLMVMVLVSTGFLGFFGDAFDFYNTTIDDEYLETYQVINDTLFEEIDAVSKQAQAELEESEQGESTTADIVTFKAITSILKLPFKGIELATHLIAGTSRKIGLPDWVTGTILTMIIIGITFTIASAFMRREI